MPASFCVFVCINTHMYVHLWAHSHAHIRCSFFKQSLENTISILQLKVYDYLNFLVWIRWETDSWGFKSHILTSWWNLILKMSLWMYDTLLSFTKIIFLKDENKNNKKTIFSNYRFLSYAWKSWGHLWPGKEDRRATGFTST